MLEDPQPASQPQSLNQGPSDTWWLGVAVAAFAVLAGQAVMVLGDAPRHLPWINGLTMIVTAAMFPLIAKGVGPSLRDPRVTVIVAAAAILLTAAMGPDVDGVRRWAGVQGVNVHVGHLVLPFAIAAATRIPGVVVTAALCALALGLALQPDAAGGALTLALVTLAYLQPRLSTTIAAAAALAASAWTLLHPDRLGPVLWAEGMPFTALAMGPALGVLVALGLTLLPAPFVFVFARGRRRRPLAGALGAYWITLIGASLMAPFPTPLVGYGAAAIFGYVVSWALLRYEPEPDPGRQR